MNTFEQQLRESLREQEQQLDSATLGGSAPIDAPRWPPRRDRGCGF